MAKKKKLTGDKKPASSNPTTETTTSEAKADTPDPKVSKLVQDLMVLPGIIKQLGISVAEAQRMLDVRHLETIAGFVTVFGATLRPDLWPPVTEHSDETTKHSDVTTQPSSTPSPTESGGTSTSDEDPEGGASDEEPTAGTPPPDRAELFKWLLMAVAPSRYQFTETRFDFRADLFEASQLVIGGGLSGGFGGFAVSVSASYGSRSEYRAAARVTTTLNAFPISPETMTALMARAPDVKTPDLQSLPVADLKMLEELTKIRGSLGEQVTEQLKHLATLKGQKQGGA